MVGKITNVEQVFPPWDITDEGWHLMPTDDLIEPKYPVHLKISGYKNVKDILGIDHADDIASISERSGKSATSKDRKKSVKSAVTDADEHQYDEHGRRLPCMFITTGGTKELDEQQYLGTSIIRPFLADKSTDIRAAMKISSHGNQVR